MKNLSLGLFFFGVSISVYGQTYNCSFRADQGYGNGTEIAANNVELTVDQPAKIVAIDRSKKNSPGVLASIENMDNNETFKGYLNIIVHFITDISKFDSEGSISTKFMFGYTSATAIRGTEVISSLSGRNNISNGDSYSLYCELKK